MSAGGTGFNAEASGSATKTRATRCTRKLRSWMVEQVDSGEYPGVVWLDHSKTMFRIPWKHAGKSDYNKYEDGALFKAWAEFKGSYQHEEEMNPAYWKTRLRCALNKSPEFCEVRTRSDDSQRYKVYRLVPESEQRLTEAPKCTVFKPGGVRVPPVRAGLGLKQKIPVTQTMPAQQMIPVQQQIPEVRRMKAEPEEQSNVKQEEVQLPVSEPFYITVTVGETPLPYSGVQVLSLSPGLGLKQEIPERPQMEEEPEEQSRVKQLAVPVPESSAVCEEREEPSLLSQRQTDAQEEAVSSEHHLLSETGTGLAEHTDDIIRVIVGDHEVIMTEVDVDDDYIQAQTTDGNTAPQNSALDISDSEEDIELSSDSDYIDDDDDDDDDDNDNDWEPSSSSASKSSALLPKYRSAAETGASANDEDMTEDEEKYQCSVCSKRFKKKFYLTMHMVTHTNEKPFCCPICNKRFRMKTELKRHGAVHSGEKPYSCSICQNAYRWKWNLQSHMKSHFEDEGEQKYKYSKDSQKHVEIPSGEKRYTCFLCKKAFHTKSQLLAHNRIHIGESVYSCAVCKKTFDIKRELRAHMRTHTGHTDTKEVLRKKYKCPYCTKKYWQNNDLQNHIRAHTGEKPYSCSICLKTFPRKSSLNRHMKAHLEAGEHQS